MEQNLNRIRNISLITFAVLFVIELSCYFIFSVKDFYGILASGFLTFLFFIATLLFYLRAVKSQPQGKLKYLLAVFISKLIISAVAFYLVYRFDYINMLAFLFSFLIFFTLFFNLEIILIYRRFLFFKN